MAYEPKVEVGHRLLTLCSVTVIDNFGVKYTLESNNFDNLIFTESLSEEVKLCRYGRSQSTQTFSYDLILIYPCVDDCKIRMRMGSKWALYVFMMLLLRKFCIFFSGIGLLILYTLYCSYGRLNGWQGKSNKLCSSILYTFMYIYIEIHY